MKFASILCFMVAIVIISIGKAESSKLIEKSNGRTTKITNGVNVQKRMIQIIVLKNPGKCRKFCKTKNSEFAVSCRRHFKSAKRQKLYEELCWTCREMCLVRSYDLSG
ncbi:uncharacterized protein LOC120333232 [Styela clava]